MTDTTQSFKVRKTPCVNVIRVYLIRIDRLAYRLVDHIAIYLHQTQLLLIVPANLPAVLMA